MNKSLKFRICYTDRDGKKSMIYSDDNRFLIGLNGKVYENYGKDWRNPTWEEVFDANETPIIQQYTGLTDSKGNDIYEGDIIEYNYGNGYGNGSRIGYVEFFAGVYHLYNLDKTADDVLGQWLKNELTVIGNIFENSELLK